MPLEEIQSEIFYIVEMRRLVSIKMDTCTLFPAKPLLELLKIYINSIEYIKK